VLFRVCQSSRDTAAQLTVAPISAGHVPWLTINVLTSQANTNNPTPPIAAPTASTPTAFRPRANPWRPARSLLFCFSCFSISVALAGKIAGKARKRPPTPGPNFSADQARNCRNQSSEKEANRELVPAGFRRAEGSILILMGATSDRRTRARTQPPPRWEVQKPRPRLL
jgi:hypothetical protein